MKVAIMGYGTIGSGVAEVLEVNKDVIAKRVGEPLELKYVLDLRDFEGDPMADKIVHDYKTIVNDPEVDIVVETMGGVNRHTHLSKLCLRLARMWQHPTRLLWLTRVQI